MKIFLAGRVSFEAADVLVEEGRFPGRQGRLVFAYLVVEQGRPIPYEELAEALWGERPPVTWKKALAVIVSKLRGLLAVGGLDGETALTSAFGCYRLELPAEAWVDIVAGARAVREAEAALAAGDSQRAAEAAARAESLARPPFLPGEDGAWVEAKRRDLADVLGRAVACLAEAALRAGDPAAAAKWAQESITLEPFRESSHRQLMQAHVAAGNRAEALRVYEACRRLLADELGAFPSPETEALYRDLLRSPSAGATSADGAAPASNGVPVPVEETAGTVERRYSRLVVVAPVAIVLAAAVAGAAMLPRGHPGSADASAVGADAVGLFQPSGRLAEQIEVGSSPGSVAYGEGSLWVANVGAHSLSRVDPEKHVTVQTIQVGSGPAAVAVGGGFVWVANGQDGTISKIDPKAQLQVDLLGVGARPTGLAYDGVRLWVASSGDRTVTRIDPRSGEKREVAAGAGADGIAIGEGAIWVTGEATASLTRLDARSGRVVDTIHVGSGANAVAVGADAVWVANSLDGTVSRIDPASNRVEATIPVGDGPGALAVADDAVWVSNELDGTLSKIDPARNAVVDTLTTGNRPEGLVLVPDGIYVAVRAGGLAHQGGRLTVLMEPVSKTAGFYSIDPGAGYFASDWQMLLQTRDGLTAFRHVGGTAGTQLVPDLATSLPNATDGGRSYTFQLRRGIRYSSGAVVRPADFRRAIERVLLLHRGPEADYLAIVGARACLDAPKRCDLTRGIVVEPSANTVTFHLTAPDPDFLARLALPPASAVPAGTPLRTREPVPGTGPYEIATYEPTRRLRLVRNPFFREWSPAAQPRGYPDEIVWRFGGAADNIAAVEHERADIATSSGLFTAPPVEVTARLQTQYASRVRLNPTQAVFYLSLNTKLPPFDDVRVRKAVNLAVDRGRLVAIFGGSAVAEPTCQVLPPNFDAYRRYCPYTVDPRADGTWTGPDLARARRLVDASGTKGQSVTVWGWTASTSHIGPYVVSVLRRLGYRADFKLSKDMFAIASNVQAAEEAWAANIVTPSGMFTPVLTCDGTQGEDPQNDSLFCDARVEAKIARARSLQATDPRTASRLWRMIDRDIVDAAPWVPYVTPRILDFLSSRVGNYEFNPQFGVLVDQLWVR